MAQFMSKRWSQAFEMAKIRRKILLLVTFFAILTTTVVVFSILKIHRINDVLKVNLQEQPLVLQSLAKINVYQAKQSQDLQKTLWSMKSGGVHADIQMSNLIGSEKHLSQLLRELTKRIDDSVVASSHLISNSEFKSYFELLSFLILSFLTSMAFGLYIAKKITSPLERATHFAQDIQAGRRDIKMESQSQHDEIGNLNHTLSEMLRGIIENEVKLKSVNESLEKLLEERTVELKMSNQKVAEFAAVATHNLEEPLRAISSFLQLLKKRFEGNLDKEALEFISYTVDDAGRMQNMIKNLLSYSQVTPSKKDFQAMNANDSLDLA